jgi:hypothetical protein
MNLGFTTIKETPDSLVQRADVTGNRAFWINWRQCKDSIRRLITLRPEVSPGGKTIYYAYKILSRTDFAPQSFAVSYSLRDSTHLLPYQPKAVTHLCNSLLANGSACDGSDTGIGKTYMGLACARELNLAPGIICKLAGISNWRRACELFGMTPAFILNWEQAKSGKFKHIRRARHPYSGRYIYKWEMPLRALLIFDEAHLGCNEDSQNHAMWIAAAACGCPTLSMSATFADRPSRLYGLFSLLNVNLPNGPARDHGIFNDWLVNTGHFINFKNTLEGLNEVEDMKAVNKLLYPRHGFRLSYNDPEVKRYFPEAICHTHLVDLAPKDTATQNALYRELLEKVAHYRALGKQAEILVADLRYRQAAELLKAQVLVDLAAEYLYEGKSVAIFVNFRETLSYLAKALNTRSMIFGAQERFGITRDQVVDAFQANKTRIVLCMAEAGGASINLHDLHGGHQRISLICPTYNPITVKQIYGRTYRAGSKTPPIIKLIYAAQTIEEKVAQVVSRKLDNISALNDGDLFEEDLFGVLNPDERKSDA